MALQVGSNVILIYAQGNGQNTYDQGTVTTMAAEYLEITNQYGSDIAYPWSHIARIAVES